MQEDNYWIRLQRRAVSRRRFLQATAGGAVGLAGATLLGCGEGGGGEEEVTPSVLTPRVNTSDRATRGGIYQGVTTADVTNLDPLASPSFTAHVVAGWIYPRLLHYKPGEGDNPATGEVEPGLAAEYEFVEPTRLVLKLRPNAVWDARPPTNKRPITADDVVFSWKKFEASSISRRDFANSANPAAPVTSIEAPDKSTVVIRTKEPFAPLLRSLAFSPYLSIMPQESDGQFDPRNDTRGAGPWILQNYERSVKFEYRKNPDWWNADKVFLDGFDYPIVPEYQSILAQFRAKQVWSYAIRQEDIIDVKRELPELNLFLSDFDRACWGIYFGLQEGSPFRDPRVRQAVSMLIDRDAWIANFYNTPAFEAAGWPVEVRWHSNISSGFEGFWMDPRSDEFGDNGKYFKYDPAEAKKLLEAAGYPNGIQTDIIFISTPQYGTTFPRHAEVFKGFLEDGGMFRLNQVNPDYATEYLPKYYFGQGDFQGIVVGAFTTYPDVGQYMMAYYHSQGARQKTALGGRNGDSRSDRLIEQQMTEVEDEERRIELVKEWQRYMAEQMLIVPYPGQSQGFSVNWPWVGNIGYYRAYHAYTAPSETLIYWWYDQSKHTA
ncbi:MAG TPA: ABC transporter substrate-binding protein [Dehalococcoidia bacterium]